MTITRTRLWTVTAGLALIGFGLVWAGGNQATEHPADPCVLALSPRTGADPLDKEIQALQEQLRAGNTGRSRLERLGWLFVAKARSSHDPGFHSLAEQTALCLERERPGDAAARLLLGHIAHNSHRFQEAEEIARRLVDERGSPYDYGLLGDALMEQGRLAEAEAAIQRMVDLKPGLQSYSRAAHLRWLSGDVDGARQLMRMAASAGGPRIAEPTAWALARLALLDLQVGDTESALASAGAALDLEKEYAPALLAKGRALFAAGRVPDALRAVSAAARRSSLPEYRWWLAEILRSAGRNEDAGAIEDEMERTAAMEDPRTYSLYLSTSAARPEEAVRLAKAELADRADVFTLDTLAWALHAAGDQQGARGAMDRALEEGTRDARLFLHAGVIAAAGGEDSAAVQWLEEAAAMRQMLMPSEQQQLETMLAALSRRES